jgi:hypothetical protein
MEEQYYFFWAPHGALAAPAVDAGDVLTAALICSPLLRHLNPVWLWGLPTHTLIKLDGIALGSLLALGLYTLPLAGACGCGWAWARLLLGIAAAATVAGGTSLLDTALAVGFAGAVLA